MTPGPVSAACRGATQRRGRLLPRACLLLLCTALLGGCAGPARVLDPFDLEPLQLAEGALTPVQARARVGTTDLMALDEEMAAFVERYTGEVRNRPARLRSLHRAVSSSSMLGLAYQANADGDARQAFHSGEANCLSYAHLFVALAREAGLDARYNWLEVRPQWNRVGERVAVRLHVNVLVRVSHREEFMVDIDPLQRSDIAGARVISDNEAAALHYNNLGMTALAEERLEDAFAYMVTALDYSPDLGLLWTNLGALYRHNNQMAAAEHSYLRTLELEPDSRTAMNNLVVLYGMQGREEARQQWLARVERYRDSNPYYHAYLGDLAGEQDDWQAALDHYRKAVRLRPEDSHLHYQLGLIHYQLGDVEATEAAFEEAIERARLTRDQNSYRARLEAIRRQQLSYSG